jgi:D-glycero-D-manno-heptose 1,7-bisphosphate phosphatase
VINEDSVDYIRTAQEWHAIPGSLEAIALLGRAGFRVVVVTNQSGIGRGLYTEHALAAIHARMNEEIERAGGRLEGIYYCPHHPRDGCDCRKPRLGLLHRIERDLGWSLAGAPFVGDKLSDVDAAEAAGARPMLVRTGDGERTLGLLGPRRVEVYPDLYRAALRIVSEAGAT